MRSNKVINMKKLFMVCLGGKVSGCNIEMHDIRFVCGESIEHTLTQLKQQWCGDKANVHIDSYCEIKHIDGYAVTVSAIPDKEISSLYFVNLGAYHPTQLMEQHSYELIVCNTPEEAKTIALSRENKHLDMIHKDRLLDVDDLLCVDLLNGDYIHLTYCGEHQSLQPDWYGYRPI
jgi:hypothetical protein